MAKGGLTLAYTAKGGTKVRERLTDRRLARVLGDLHDLPGQDLISWIDEDGAPRAVTSEQVNARLADITEAEGMTAKTFRTWAGSTAALEVALQPGPLTIKALSGAAAARLHNTPTIARMSYIHPGVIALAEAEEAERAALTRALPETRGLRIAERALLRLLS